MLSALNTICFLNNSNSSSSIWYWEEERRKEELNINFKKDFEEYFKNQIKEIQNQITPDLFQIEPFYIEEMVNLINLITEKEKYEENLFNEVKKIVLDNAKKNIEDYLYNREGLEICPSVVKKGGEYWTRNNKIEYLLFCLLCWP